MARIAVALGLLLVLSPNVSRADVYITELLASNVAGLTDQDGDHSDWIEIYNDGAAAVDLAGWTLTDDAAAPLKWQFPSTIVAPGAYLVVFASDKNRAVSGAQLHTNFKLSSGGEYLGLLRPGGVTIEHEYAPSFPAQVDDLSWGLAGDLSQQRCFTNPTPGAANNEATVCGTVAPIQFSHGRGFYSAPFSLALSSATPAATIRYTLDGSEPSGTHGSVYSGPIAITTTTAVRAIAFAPPLTPLASMTHSYLFLADVLQQTGAGFPTEGFAADYAMDPRVVSDPRYAPTILDDMKAVPTISVVMDVDDLFGQENGIYTHPRARGIDWERRASAELIRPDGGAGFQVNCGTRIQGRLSREKNKKKSLRLAFKAIYGPPKLHYPFFADSPVNSFDKLRLRASHNKSWSFGITRADYIRDQWARDTQRDMGQVTSHGAFYHLYLNGLYWGLYNVVEQPEAEFALAYLGGNEEDWDVLKPGEITDGNRDAWDAAHDIARAGVESPSSYAALEQYVDVDNLIDYMLMNFHAGTVDWDDSNWYAARKRAPGEGFRFFSWDTEQSMEFINSVRVGVHNVSAPSAFYFALRLNEEFRVRFGDRAHSHLFDDGALTAASSAARYATRVTEIQQAINGESARWGDTGAHNDPFDRDSDWIKEIEWIRLAYFPRRSHILLQQLRDSDLYPVLDAPVLDPPSGFAPAASLTAGCAAIHYTTDGSDPRASGGAVSASAQLYTAPIAIPSPTTVRARCREAGQWSALEQGQFGPEVPLRVTELMYNPAPPPAGPFVAGDFEFVELRNIAASPLAIGGLRFSSGITFVFPAQTLAAGASLLVVKNVAAFESRYGTGKPIAGSYTGSLANEGERVRVETAAGDEVLDFVYDDAWYPQTDGPGRSLVVVDDDAERSQWSNAAGWRASTFDGGSPGAPELPACSDGVDNDGDSLIDAAGDPGCASASQDSENPACNDGADNDGDGAADLADSGCEAASDTDERAQPIDGFLCRTALSTDPADTSVGADLSVSDAIESGRLFELRGAKTLCAPAAVNDEDGEPLDPATHLVGFALRAADSLASPEQQAVFARGLGPIYLDSFGIDRLMLPAAVDSVAAVPPPVAGSHAVDAFACYRVKANRTMPRYFPRGVQLLVRTAEQEARYDLRKPTRLCYAASVDGEAFANEQGMLACYDARVAREFSDEPAASPVFVGAAIGPSRVEVGRSFEVCVPAD